MKKKKIVTAVCALLAVCAVMSQAFAWSSASAPGGDPSSEAVGIGYLGVFSAGIMGNAVIDGNGQTIFSARTVQGVRFGEHAAFGVGIGIERFVTVNLYPIFFDARAFLTSGKAQTFLCAEVGQTTGSSTLGTVGEGGFMAHGGIGIAIPFSGQTSIMFDVGYEYQNIREQQHIYWYNGYMSISQLYARDVGYNLVTASTGIIF